MAASQLTHVAKGRLGSRAVVRTELWLAQVASVRWETWGLDRARSGPDAPANLSTPSLARKTCSNPAMPKLSACSRKPKANAREYSANSLRVATLWRRHITIDPKLITTEHHREAGTVHVGYEFWKRLGLDDILKARELPERTRQLACAMTLNRLIGPASEHAMPAWMKRTALGDILKQDFDGLGESSLYRILDVLHPHRSAIEAELVERERSLFNLDSSIYLYDLTSLYFEGLAAANPKAKRGHNRDGRPEFWLS
jgi:hypothetical protein